MFEKSEETSPRRKSLAKQLNVLIPEKKDGTGEKVKRWSAVSVVKLVRMSGGAVRMMKYLRISTLDSRSRPPARACSPGPRTSVEIGAELTIRREERIKNMTYHGS